MNGVISLQDILPTPFHRWESFLYRRYPLIVGSFLLALFAVVAGLFCFPFSGVLLGLLFFLVGSFFLVALIVLSATWFCLAVAVFGAFRWALLGLVHRYATGVASKSENPQHKPDPAGERSNLWDRWLDGS
jgi:hypothetical protein